MNHSFTARRAFWPQDSELLRSVRHAVFVIEQKVSSELEWEGDDDQYQHVVALDSFGNAVGTGRESPAGKR